MKLPKGVKKLKVEGSAEALKKAIVKFCTEEFNGYIRVTAPKGVRKAGIVLFLQGLPQISVYQSADRSLYGADALPEIKKRVRGRVPSNSWASDEVSCATNGWATGRELYTKV